MGQDQVALGGGPARDTDSEISKKKSPVAGDFVAGGKERGGIGAKKSVEGEGGG